MILDGLLITIRNHFTIASRYHLQQQKTPLRNKPCGYEGMDNQELSELGEAV
jgi:hypothetical protein